MKSSADIILNSIEEQKGDFVVPIEIDNDENIDEKESSKEEKNDDSETYIHYVDVWSNPTIALIDESMHDFRGIYRNLKVYWKDDCFRKFYLGKYIETSEIVLQLLHSLIDGNIITEISFPQSRGKNYTFYKYVRNPKYDNNWTLEREI